MPAPTISLDVIQIKTPCNASWDAMEGSDTRRFCEACELHVHDLSAIPRRDAEALIQRARTGRVCVQMRRGPDGRILTREDREAHGGGPSDSTRLGSRDSRTSAQKFRGRGRRRAAYAGTMTLVGLAAFALVLLSATGAWASRDTTWRQKWSQWKAGWTPASPPPVLRGAVAVMGEAMTAPVAAPPPMDIMGDIALPEPVPVPADHAMLLGQMRLPDAPEPPEQIAF